MSTGRSRSSDLTWPVRIALLNLEQLDGRASPSQFIGILCMYNNGFFLALEGEIYGT